MFSLLLLLVLVVGVAGTADISTAIAAEEGDGKAVANTLLNLNSRGTVNISAIAQSTSKQSPFSVSAQAASVLDPTEIRGRKPGKRNPRLAIDGPTPPLPPPDPNTAYPNPEGKTVTTANPGFKGFNALSHTDQRTAGTGEYTGTQASLEPPDQALCVSDKYVIDSVNVALTIRTLDGTALTPVLPLNQFFKLRPQIVRSSPPVFGDFTSDPKCYWDAETNRWFVTILQLDRDPATGAFTGPSSVLLAVSASADPTKEWAIFSINTTNDGTKGTPKRINCPCLGDQPLIGANNDGFYISTNEFPVFSDGFNGALLYAISKNALVKVADGSVSLTPAVVFIDVSQELVPYGGISYSVQPATQPPGDPFGKQKNGTEYFMSSLNFEGKVDNRIAIWALTNTRTLDRSVPNVKLSLTVIKSALYGVPVPVIQKEGPRPLGESLGEPAPKINSNDDRMQQVVYAGGLLYSGLTTIIQKPGEAPRSSVVYFIVAPFWGKDGVKARTLKDGYIAVNGNSTIFPAVGVNRWGRAVVTFTLAGSGYYPSAAYANLSVLGAGKVHIAAAGAGPDDGFSGYAAYGSATGVGRWGDYSAAVATPDGKIWFATEYIPNVPRTLLANWGTYVGVVDPARAWD